MREILFRGKDKVKNRWVYGNFSHISDTEDKENPITYWISDFLEQNCWDCYPSSIGQYTGFKDKNGKKIFEGDILTNAEGATYLVFFDESEGTFDWARVNENYEHNLPNDHSDFVIKGNKFDCPEF